MQASVVIGKAEKILVDEANGHWAAGDLLGWLNTAQRLVVLIRPDAKTTRGEITLVDGPHQSIPAEGIRLIKVVRNKDGRAITLVSEEQLTNFDPNWYEATAKTVQKHYLFDELEPKRFDCYPPAIAGNIVLAVWSAQPTDCADEDDSIDLDDIYEPALIHLVCHYAYLQDAEDTANQALANQHLQAATLILTGKTQADQKTNPAASQPSRINPKVR